MKYEKWEDIVGGDYLYLEGKLCAVDLVRVTQREVNLIRFEDMSEVTITPSDLPNIEIAHRLKKGDRCLMIPRSEELIRRNSINLKDEEKEALHRRELRFDVQFSKPIEERQEGYHYHGTVKGETNLRDPAWWVKSTMVVPFKIGSDSEVMFPEVFGDSE